VLEVLAGVHDLPLFVAAGLLLNITPGADLALIGARSAAQGFRCGAAAALGVGAGCVVHVAAAALGLSALIASSAAAFAVLRWAGAAYLVWLGIGLLRGSGASASTVAAGPTPTVTWRRSFAQGFLTNALNPKVALFFLAFLPQFIDAAAPDKALAFVALGAVFAVNGTLVNVAFAALIARLRGALGSQPTVGRWLGRGVGALFITLGVRLAWFDGSGR
jgi:threonine/homoserine/homoserine lactone efflux protein